MTRALALAAVLALAGAARAADPPKPAAPAKPPPPATSTAKPTAPAAAKPTTPPRTPPAPGKTPGKPAAKDAAGKDAPDKPAAHNGPRTRANSVLKSDKLLPGRVDLRSESERKRDAELRSHFSRVAELDAIAAVAADKGDVGLQEYVELVRRKELQRHQKVMMALRRAEAQASALATAGAQP